MSSTPPRVACALSLPNIFADRTSTTTTTTTTHARTAPPSPVSTQSSEHRCGSASRRTALMEYMDATALRSQRRSSLTSSSSAKPQPVVDLYDLLVGASRAPPPPPAPAPPPPVASAAATAAQEARLRLPRLPLGDRLSQQIAAIQSDRPSAPLKSRPGAGVQLIMPPPPLTARNKEKEDGYEPLPTIRRRVYTARVPVPPSNMYCTPEDDPRHSTPRSGQPPPLPLASVASLAAAGGSTGALGSARRPPVLSLLPR